MYRQKTLTQRQLRDIPDVTLAAVTGVDGTGLSAASKVDVDARLATIQAQLNKILEALRKD